MTCGSCCLSSISMLPLYRMDSTFPYQFYDTTTAAWDAMYETLAEAERSIFWDVYIFWDDKAGKRFLEILCDKAKNGVNTKIILDSFGSRNLTKKGLTQLQEAGVEVLWYNQWYHEKRLNRWVSRLWKRDHRKILIIDEEMVFIGGVNIEFPATQWYDLHIKIVDKERIKPLLKEFFRTYLASGGKQKKDAETYLVSSFGKISNKNDQIRFINPSPDDYKSRHFLKKFYISAIKSAQKTFTLVTPYYVPHRKFLLSLTEACERGVEVSIITPVRSDHRWLDSMAYYFLEFSEKLGAKIYLMPRMNHAKAFAVDDTMGLVGSSNFTRRSFRANAEADVLFTRKDMVHELSEILEKWKKESATRETSGHKEWPIRSRMLGWVASRFQDYV